MPAVGRDAMVLPEVLMFIVMIHYDAPLTVIDSLMKSHVTFLEKHFRTGAFIAAGRQEPRTGGVILARVPSEDALRAIMEEDPFVTEGAASFQIVQFRTSFHAPGFAAYADPRTRKVT